MIMLEAAALRKNSKNAAASLTSTLSERVENVNIDIDKLRVFAGT